MGQTRFAVSCGMVVLGLLTLGASGCDRPDPAASDPSAPRTVASLSPAATDLILGMGLRERLVAVSSYDVPAIAGDLPRVGDYERIDWEKLAELRPSVMVVQMHADRMPAGVRDRAARLGITLVSVQIDRLDDIPRQLRVLGDALGEPGPANEAATRFESRIADIRASVAGRPAVRTLLILNDEATFVAGRATFLDDVLSVAGGVNAIDAAGYPTIDRERLASIAPEAIVQILPDANPSLLEQAGRGWGTMPDVPAVRDGRVLVITEPWAMLPGYRQTDLARTLAARLHPASTRPSDPAAPRAP